MSSRTDAFEKAKEERKKQKEKESDRKAGGGNFTEYEEVAYVAVEVDQDKVIRVLGNPKSNRMGDPTSAKDVNISLIMGDNQKMFRCIWPIKDENSSWILWKVFDKVMSYKYDATLNSGKGGRIYHNADTHPKLFTRVAKNDKVDVTFETGWKPTTSVLMNVIDRQDLPWHKEKKHTKLLSKKERKTEDNTYYDAGVPQALYNAIWDDIVEYYGDWEGYDISVRKEKADPWYKAYHTVGDLIKIKENVRQFIVEGPLTEEEKSWERYDLDKLFKITSYQKIFKNLGIFIQQVDAELGTKFYTELQGLVEEEKKKYEAEKPKEEVKTEKAEIKAEVKDNTPARPKKEVKEESKAFDPKTIDLTIYKGLATLPEDVLGVIKGVKADGSFEYDPSSGQIYKCTTCGFKSPRVFPSCPCCASEF